MANSDVLKNLVTNPKVIDSVFGNDVFSLENVKFAKTEINYNEGSIYLYIDLKDFPSAPPKKWTLQKFNTVQLVLRVFEIKEFSSKGFFEQGINVNVVLVQKDDLINLTVLEENKILYCKIKARWLYIDRIEGYQSDLS